MPPSGALRAAVRAASRAGPRTMYRLGAVLVRGRRPIYWASNRSWHTHPWGSGPARSLHAEARVLWWAARRIGRDLRSHGLLVIRLSPSETLRNAQPCKDCWSLLCRHNVRWVAWSTGNGFMRRYKPKEEAWVRDKLRAAWVPILEQKVACQLTVTTLEQILELLQQSAIYSDNHIVIYDTGTSYHVLTHEQNHVLCEKLVQTAHGADIESTHGPLKLIRQAMRKYGVLFSHCGRVEGQITDVNKLVQHLERNGCYESIPVVKSTFRHHINTRH